MRLHLNRKIIILAAILCFCVFLGVVKGAVNISFLKLFIQDNRAILLMRCSRLLLAAVVGSGLAVSGIVLQAILRNPLAEPYLLGTSSGAGLGAVVALMLGIGSLYLPLFAFLGALASVIFVYAISCKGTRVPVESLVLSGVIVSIAFSGVIIFWISVSGNEAIHGVMWWLWGSLQVYDFKLLFIVATAVILGIFAIYFLAQDLNAISLGEEEAIHVGIDAQAVKNILLVITSLVTASIVSVSGVIGFVGLIIPHIMRFLVGPNHRVLIPCSCMAAAAFMILSDVISRSIMPPLEIPIGVITALIGAPIFIVLLRMRQAIK